MTATLHHVNYNAVNIVKGEIHNVLSVMRVNARWASENRFYAEISEESPLISHFKKLHYQLETITELNDFDTVEYLEPFLKIITSEKTSGSDKHFNQISMITGRAISSINKFLLYGLLTSESLRAKDAINSVAFSVSRCRFEETHREADEMVLMKLLELVEYCLRCPGAGPLISGRNVWRMVQTCYSISCQERSSLLLCHTAENTLAHLVLTVFSRISELECEPSPVTTESKSYNSLVVKDTSSSSENNMPYGIPVLRRILSFLVSLIDPTCNEESTRILGLSLINIVLETAGTGLGSHRNVVSVLQSDLSKFLLQNSETNDLSILSLTLRVVFNLFNSIKDHLKVQLEVFFTSVHMRILDSPSCSFEQKELAMESLVEFAREPALMLDLYINYDCDVHCTNLFEVLCCALTKNVMNQMKVFNEQRRLNVLNLLAFEALAAVIGSISRRCVLVSDDVGGRITSSTNYLIPENDDIESLLPPKSSVREVMNYVMRNSGTAVSTSDVDSDAGGSFDDNSRKEMNEEQLAWLHTARERTAEILQQRKRHKKRLALASSKFNTEKKKWIEYAQQLDLLPDPPTADAVASFLLRTPGLNKTKIGEYLGEPEDKYPFNHQVREAYAKLFNFCGLTVDAALRNFLAKFRLPGEAQKIDRLMELFSKQYYVQNTSKIEAAGEVETNVEERANYVNLFANEDTVYVLSFSIIMLNTDLHNNQVAKKMSLAEFLRNNRGINDGKSLPDAFLTEIYTNIQQKEIQMMADVHSQPAQPPSLNDDQLSSNQSQGSTSSNDHAKSLENAPSDHQSQSVSQWDGVLRRNEDVVGASFSSNSSIVKIRAGLYEKEMFKLICARSLESFLAIFSSTTQLMTMKKAQKALKDCACVLVYFELTEELNNLLITPLANAFNYFASQLLKGEDFDLELVKTSLQQNNNQQQQQQHDEEELSKDNGTSKTITNNLRLAKSFAKDLRLLTMEENEEEVDDDVDDDEEEEEHKVEEASKTRYQHQSDPQHRNRLLMSQTVEIQRHLIGLSSVLDFLAQYHHFLRQSWTPLVELILLLNELNVIPVSLVEMDDFVDAYGVPLPNTSVAVPASTSVEVALTGVSGKTREDSRRRAEERARFLAKNRSNNTNHQANSQNSTFWSSLWSLWYEEEASKLNKQEAELDMMAILLQKCITLSGDNILTREKWCKMCKKLSCSSLQLLIRALIETKDPFRVNTNFINNSSSTVIVESSCDYVALQENAILSLELSVNILLANERYFDELFPLLAVYFERILKNAAELIRCNFNVLVERVFVNILRLCIRFLHFTDKRKKTMLLSALALIHEVPSDYMQMYTERLCSGMMLLLRANSFFLNNLTQPLSVILNDDDNLDKAGEVEEVDEGSNLNEEEGEEESDNWVVIFQILEDISRLPDGFCGGFEALQFLLKADHLNEKNFTHWLKLATTLSQNTAPIAIQVLEVVQSLAVLLVGQSSPLPSDSTDINVFSSTSSPVAKLMDSSSKCQQRQEYWLEILHFFFRHLSNNQSNRILQHHQQDNVKNAGVNVLRKTWNCLESCLVCPGMRVSSHYWQRCFEEVLFPLTGQIRSMKTPNTEIRIYSLMLLNKTFLHNVSGLCQIDDFSSFWKNVLHHFAVELTQKNDSKQNEENDVLYETSFQLLQNMLMVLNAEGIFEFFWREQQQDLIQLTYSVIDTVCPLIKEQINLPYVEHHKESAVKEEIVLEKKDELNNEQIEIHQREAISSSGNPQIDDDLRIVNEVV